ncbi:hypothetical protein EON81_02880 [bacterium]|nr:MAG: hypothetical protein EON81_02880 [bacterium]
MRRSILLFSALALVWGCAGDGPNAVNNSATPILALVGAVSSPVANEIAGLGPIVGASDESANLLVVDGDTFSGNMAEESALKAAWQSGKGLLVLDADEGDLERDLIRLTGIVPDKELAAVYLRKRKDGGIDQIHLDKRAAGDDKVAGEMRQEFLRRVGVAFREELPIQELRQSTRLGGRGFQLGPFPISKVVTKSIGQSLSSTDATGTAPARTATVNLSDTITVVGSGSYGGRYDSTAYIVLTSNGNSSVAAFDTMQIDSTVFHTYFLSGYSNMRQKRTVGLSLNAGQPILASAQPANITGSKDVTSGVNFEIGVDSEGPQGGIGFNFESTTHIEGWGIEQTLGAGVINWVYQEKIDGDGDSYGSVGAGLFDGTDTSFTLDDFGVYTASALASNVVQSAPAVVWTVPETSGATQATVTSEITGYNTAWIRNDPTVGPSGATWFRGDAGANGEPNFVVSTDGSVVMDLTELWNQMGYLASVDVPTSTAPGQLSITVKLDHPAPLAGMPIAINSSSPGVIATRRLAIPAGETDYTFQLPVQKNFPGDVRLDFVVNGLSKSATVNILP